MPLSAVPPIPLAAADQDPTAFAAALGASFERFGFVILAEHGIDPAVIEAAYAQTAALFALPEAHKRAYHLPGGGGQRGYTPFGTEAAKGAAHVDLKEFWHIGRDLSPGDPQAADMPPNVWPTELPAFAPAMRALYAALDAVGLRVLTGVARHLGLAADHFEPLVGRGNSILRLLHYPPVTAPTAGVRAEAHEDINVITLLLGAEEAGLELLDRDGRWLPVAPPPGALVVNVGDMLQRLTNHRLPSTTHRVVNPAPDRAHLPRYSIPFFQHFAPDVRIETLAGCISAATPNRYPTPITARDYLAERLREIRLA